MESPNKINPAITGIITDIFAETAVIETPAF